MNSLVLALLMIAESVAVLRKVSNRGPAVPEVIRS